MAKDWSEFNQFEHVLNDYMPDYGEGDDKAAQAATAVCKLVYKWYNDGDVYDNNYGLTGWANDISSFANWLHKNVDEETTNILERIYKIRVDEDYEDLLYDLASHVLNPDFLYELSGEDKVDSIYDCDGPFEFNEKEEEEDDWEDDEDEDSNEDYWS